MQVRHALSRHCVIFAVDIAGFTDCNRDDEVQLALREALYGLLIRAFHASGIPWRDCLHHDLGDGVLVVIPAQMPTATMVDPMVGLLRAGLRRHNRLSSDAARIRLRVALHVGEVQRDRYGLTGTALNHLFELLEASELKATLDSCGGELALIVSDYVYENVIRHSPGSIDPTTFRSAAAATRPRVHGWIHVPAAGHSAIGSGTIPDPPGDVRRSAPHGREARQHGSLWPVSAG